MSIQPTANSAASRYQANNPTESNTTSINSQTTKPSASELSAENRRQLNQTILDNQLSLSLQSDNKAMNLLYRAISDAVEKRMAAQAPQSADNSADTSTGATTETGLNKTYSNEDTSPQATADRIVSFATNFYQAFREQNPELNDKDGLEQFMQEIGKGIDQGFADARDILTGLKKLEGKVADDIDETYSLIQQGLQDFRDRTQQPKDQAAAAE